MFISPTKSTVNVARLKAKAIAGAFIVTIAGIAAAATLAGASAAPVSTPNCDNNAVVYCGATSVGQLQQKFKDGDKHNSAASIHNIYDSSKFGITSSDINSMSNSNTGTGYVTKSGDVYVTSGSQKVLVATDAWTAGRTNMSGSTKMTNNGTTFYARKPSVSFANDELSAMVYFKNGVFQFAILNSCGNPVTATPKKPGYSITKQVRAGNSGSYGSNVSVKSGSTVSYQITADSTGAIPVDNVTVRDSLPKGITYTSGTLDENGKAVSAANASKFFGSGWNIGTIWNGKKDVFTFSAVAGKVKDTDSSCVEESLTNTGYISAPGLSGKQSSAKVSTTCTKPQPKPGSLACTLLTAVAGTVASDGSTQYTLNATASATNAKLAKYVFTPGDGSADITVNSSATSANTKHTYAPGTYTASVTVSGTDNAGKAVQAPVNAKCSTSITVQMPECKPGVQAGSKECFTYTCDNFTVAVDNITRKVTVTAFDASSTNTAATLSNVVIDWGDGSTNTVPAAQATSQAHIFTTDSSTITATGQFTVSGETTPVTSTSCTQQVSFTKPTTPSTTPPTLPNTGAGDTIGLFLGAVVAGTIGFRVFMTRKLARR